MLEWLLTIGAAELGKVIFEQVLKLGQAAAEDYVKDFFKDCLKEGITAAKPEVTKKAVAAALKAFLLIVADQLEDQELSRAEIRDRYDPALVQFVQNESVKPLLGRAFDQDCAAVDVEALAAVWRQSSLKGKPFPVLPAEFDWQQVGSKYLKKVRRILRETPELRELLEAQLLEQIAHNTAQISPGFDLAKYRDSLQCSYGHLQLYNIDSTDRMDAIKLWTMFIEQTVREALPPTRYELPSDLKRQLQAQGQLEADLAAEALDQYRSEYFQQPSRKVLEALGGRSSLALLKKEGTGVEKEGTGVAQSPPFEGGLAPAASKKRGIEADAQRAVILGDPGAGKSTLLQYLALDWAEGKTATLPLLIELREYVLAASANFLEFLHRGRGADWQFDQQELHQYLQSQPTLVMFDGLDEVFERSTQAAIIDDIIRFAQQYPKAQIIITSRIIGYNPERLRNANFRHFTIQPLNTEEIHEFIDRWYALALGDNPDKPRLVTRLKEAIANSNAIQNLADNPLLLTMMAILNRRQELPRDRADLYDQASRVLLYHWDVDHKRLQLPMDTIGRREKQEMLRLIAYEMQTSEEGLKGNLITAERLTRILTDYLREQGFSEPREKATRLIDQLRHRNWILCDRGADTYGFVHRTFLEYFCAVEIVNRFEKQRTLTFEQLRDEVFGQHWQDETWHEVLRLICGMIDAKFAVALIEFLMKFIDSSYDEPSHYYWEDSLFLATRCLFEIKDNLSTEKISEEIKDRLMTLANEHYLQPDNIRIDVYSAYDFRLSSRAIELLIEGWRDMPETKEWLMSISYAGALGSDAAIYHVVRGWSNDPDIPIWLNQLIDSGVDPLIRSISMETLLTHYSTHPKTLELLRHRAANDPDEQLLQWAEEQLSRMAAEGE